MLVKYTLIIFREVKAVKLKPESYFGYIVNLFNYDTKFHPGFLGVIS